MSTHEPDNHDLEDALEAGRPAPSRQFGDRLREHLLSIEASERRPAQLWLLVGAYACAGLLLLVVAAVAAGGGGL
jgi:hypothetical protein